MTEHQANFLKMSFLVLYCIVDLLPDIFHNCMSRFNYSMSSLIKSKLLSNPVQLKLSSIPFCFLAIVFHLSFLE